MPIEPVIINRSWQGGGLRSCVDSRENWPIVITPSGTDDTPVETGHHLNQRGGTRTAKRVGTRDHGGFVMSEQAVLLGGWTAYHKLSAKDQAVFNQVLEGFVGVQYTPFEVST